MKRTIAMVVVCVAVLTEAGCGTPAIPAAERGGFIETALPTNATARVQCWAQTKSGNRCKRRAVSGERYCRQHSATIAPKKPLEKCRSFTDGGKPCDVKPVEGGIYCKGHLK